jgi:hypothetical protein
MPKDPLSSRKNFALAQSGASILYASKNIVQSKAILDSSRDTYLTVSECSHNKVAEVIINLADDVLVDTIVVSNREDFSATFDQI